MATGRRARRNKASSTSDDPARAKRPILLLLAGCWQTKKKTWKVLNCHSKMRPLDTEKDVQTKAPTSSYIRAGLLLLYIPGCIDCTHIYIYIEIGTGAREREREKSAASQCTYKCCPNNRATNTEREADRENNAKCTCFSLHSPERNLPTLKEHNTNNLPTAFYFFLYIV